MIALLGVLRIRVLQGLGVCVERFEKALHGLADLGLQG